ncbi:MAG: HAD family hydrolase [Solirubrobacterales bacterium]
MVEQGERRAAAFFDLDKTLMAGSSAMPFARAARRRGFVSRRQLTRWGIDHLRYRLRGASDEQTSEAIEVAKQMLSGVPVREIERMVPELLAEILPRIYPAMLDEVHRHQKEGRPTFIVSAAGSGIVDALAAVLGMEGGVGTRYAVGPDGSFTGELEGPFVYGPGKVEAMKQFAAEHDIDLAASYAYSDSASDLPMLKVVGNPVVVNPDAELLGAAKAEDWRVLRFEKLGRRLAIVGATALAALVGGGAGLATRRRSRRGKLRGPR